VRGDEHSARCTKRSDTESFDDMRDAANAKGFADSGVSIIQHGQTLFSSFTPDTET
jgi:hypothetical protein